MSHLLPRLRASAAAMGFLGAAVVGAAAPTRGPLAESPPPQSSPPPPQSPQPLPPAPRVWLVLEFDNEFTASLCRIQDALAFDIGRQPPIAAHVTLAGPAPAEPSALREWEARLDHDAAAADVEDLRRRTATFVRHHGIRAFPMSFPGFGTFLQSNNSKVRVSVSLCWLLRRVLKFSLMSSRTTTSSC